MSRPLRSRTARHRVPVVVVTGIDDAAVDAAALSLQLGHPRAVTVRHTIDVERQVLTRVVSDLTGVLEREEIELEHACVTCAIREDIVPTLERLAADGRWAAVVACLPLAAEARQVCRVLGRAPRDAPHVSVSAVMAALDGETVAHDLLGDDLLDERDLATSFEDRRGVGEVATAMVEYADVVCLTDEPRPDELDLVRALARPGAAIVCDPSRLDAETAASGLHQHATVESWVAQVRRGALPPVHGSGAWRLDLSSDRPFHPARLQDSVALLGGGRHRSRGCFWLPTRPTDVCAWEGAGGQVSVGCTERWGRGERLTRITVIGLCDDDCRAEVVEAFHRCLLTDDEVARLGTHWNDAWDGLEPWLGPIGDSR